MRKPAASPLANRSRLRVARNTAARVALQPALPLRSGAPVTVSLARWLAVHRIAGPCCGALLADMGATVIKVEPPEGDSMRYVQRQPQDADGNFQQNGECIDHGFTLDNRGKQSIAVNLADPDGQQIVRDLAAKADVFLTNLLPVRLGRFGLDYPTIDASNPRIVYASVSGWGLSGPDPDRLAFDMTAFFARGGIMSMWGQPGDPPVKPRSGQGDHQTGLAAFSAILAALLLRVSSAPSRAESPHPPSLLCLLAAR